MSATDLEPPRQRRSQQQRRDATRAALVDAAVAAVLATGPGTSVEVIARRAGVSKGALQHHFDSKIDLLEAVVETGWAEMVARSSRIEGGSTVGSIVDALVSATWLAFLRAPCRAAFMVSVDPSIDPRLASRLAPSFDDSRRSLDAGWTHALAEVVDDEAAVRRARRFVRSHLLGMLAQRQLPGSEPQPDDELSAVCAAAVALLTGKGNR